MSNDPKAEVFLDKDGKPTTPDKAVEVVGHAEDGSTYTATAATLPDEAKTKE